MRPTVSDAAVSTGVTRKVSTSIALMIWPRTIACDAALSKASIQQLSLTFRTSSSEAARRRYLLVSTRIFRLRGSGAPAGSAMLVGSVG